MRNGLISASKDSGVSIRSIDLEASRYYRKAFNAAYRRGLRKGERGGRLVASCHSFARMSEQVEREIDLEDGS